MVTVLGFEESVDGLVAMPAHLLVKKELIISSGLVCGGPPLNQQHKCPPPGTGETMALCLAPFLQMQNNLLYSSLQASGS